MTIDLAKIKSDAEIIAYRCNMLLMTLPVRDVLAMVAEIEQLRAQVRLAGVAGEIAVNDAIGRAATEFGVAVFERDQLKAENEALRKDAERYRWFRSSGDSDLAYLDSRGQIYPEALDEEIDAAMAKEKA